MMDRTVDVGRLATWGGWLAVCCLIAASGTAMAMGHMHLGQWFGFGACATSAFAATMQIRGYMIRMVKMVCAATGGSAARPTGQVRFMR